MIGPVPVSVNLHQTKKRWMCEYTQALDAQHASNLASQYAWRNASASLLPAPAQSVERSRATTRRHCTGAVPSMCMRHGAQEDAHQEAVRGLQLEAAKQVSKLRQEVEAGARGLAGRAGAPSPPSLGCRQCSRGWQFCKNHAPVHLTACVQAKAEPRVVSALSSLPAC